MSLASRMARRPIVGVYEANRTEQMWVHVINVCEWTPGIQRHNVSVRFVSWRTYWPYVAWTEPSAYATVSRGTEYPWCSLEVWLAVGVTSPQLPTMGASI